MNRVRFGYAAAARNMDYYEYNVRICLALLYPPQALVATAGCVALGGVLFSLLSGGVHCRVDLQPLAVKSLREGGVAGRWLAVPGAAG